MQDARGLDKAGVFSIVLECVPCQLAKLVTDSVSVPTIGIGAGPYCDGQLLIVSDVLGIWEAFKPKFVKRYAQLADESIKALQAYVGEVRERKFPTEEHCYKMKAGELERLEELLK